MCFFTKQTHDAQQLENRFNARLVQTQHLQPAPIINGFTFPHTPVITDAQPDRIRLLQWGLIPRWARDNSIRQYTLNARIETLSEKPSFRDSVRKRCLVIADGFYEWQWLDAQGMRKQKYLITLPDNGLFAFAGIWSEWREPQSGIVRHTYSIVTTEAAGIMREIHNSKKRMPLILTPENERQWLSGAALEHFAHPRLTLQTHAV